MMNQPTHKHHIGSLIILGTLALTTSQPAQANDWYFKVTNATKSKIIKLEAKEQGGSWGTFDLQGGIVPGETATMEWDKSTNNEDCVQFIRAKFSDGSYSEATKFDFCKDLDTPIEFSD